VRGFFVISVLVSFIGVSSYFNSRKSGSALAFKTSLTERDLAIDQAIRDGKKTYTFTTHFIPGIGYINDPQAYQQQTLDQLQQQAK